MKGRNRRKFLRANEGSKGTGLQIKMGELKNIHLSMYCVIPEQQW
jgi:hypothetical protein